MSARQAKNEASMGKMQPRTIDDLVNINVEGKDETNNKVNLAVNKEINNDANYNVKTEIDNEVNVEVNKDTDNEINTEIDRMKELKAKMQKGRQKQSNKQVTVYLTPENYKRFNKLKAKGEKSELINQLLDMYFED